MVSMELAGRKGKWVVLRSNRDRLERVRMEQRRESSEVENGRVWKKKKKMKIEEGEFCWFREVL